MRRDFTDWTLRPDKLSEKESESITQVRVVAGDHHGRPDSGSHTHSRMKPHSGGDARHTPDLPFIDEKAADTTNRSDMAADVHHERPEITPNSK